MKKPGKEINAIIVVQTTRSVPRERVLRRRAFDRLSRSTKTIRWAENAAG
jgi:hypothetical protein